MGDRHTSGADLPEGDYFCPACATPLPAGARFCPSCGSRADAHAGVTTELRIVTMLFVDLVGFTALGERHDPEDLDATLRAYFAMARSVIERHGGQVEKYIGDAVVGLFGVPVAREDDAEHAVLAALQIVAGMDTMSLAGERLVARAGVNTGKALVRHHRLPGAGQAALVGDAVNTCARLQALAPGGGVVVGEVTHTLTTGRIAYRRLRPQKVKGKAEALIAWAALGPAQGAAGPAWPATAFTGRQKELSLLVDLLESADTTSTPHFVLLTGEAGIGKSRLLLEFARLAQGRAGETLWRCGHCPPAGDDGAFLALAEILREQAGIQETDDQETAARKLGAALNDDPERTWLEHHLRPLLGLKGAEAGRPGNFNAWSRFLHTLGAGRLAVVAFEDIHWASDATLDFLRHLTGMSAQTRLLVICTARATMTAAHPEFAATFEDEAGSQPLHVRLGPLSSRDRMRMIEDASRGSDGETAEALARRSGGNPLFIEELVRYVEEGVNKRAGTSSEPDLPASLQALIAARLDELDQRSRAAVSDAAVFGQRFWSGALVAVSALDEAELHPVLGDLVVRGLIRPELPSSLPGEPEFSFSHELVRDVAYQRLTRRRRAIRHRAAAVWVQSLQPQPTRELADLIARHFSTALRLATAARDAELIETITLPCARALAASARQTFPLDARAGERLFSEAARLVAADDPERPALLSDWGEAVAQAGDLARSIRLLEEALAGHQAVRDSAGSVRTMIRLARFLYLVGDTRHEQVTRRALALAEEGPRGPEWLMAKGQWCFLTAASFAGEAAVAAANDTLRACAELDEEPSPLVYGYRGMARCDLGDPEGIDDLQLALRITRHKGLSYDFSALSYNLADELHIYRGPAAAMGVVRTAMALATRRADETSTCYLQAMLLCLRSYAGQWDAALAGGDVLLPELQRQSQAADYVEIAVMAAYLHCMRGAPVDPALLRRTCEARPPTGPEELMSYWIHLAWTYLRAGDTENAVGFLTRAADTRDGFGCPLQTGMTMPLALDASWEAGDVGLAARFARGVPETRAIDRNVLLTHQARLAEADGDLERAAEEHQRAAAAWHAFGAPFHEAQSLVSRGRCLLGIDRRAETLPPLREAHRILRRLKAKPLLDEVDALLRQVPDVAGHATGGGQNG